MKQLFLATLMVFAVNANAVVINETTDAVLDVTFTDEGLYNTDHTTGLDWLNFADLVNGDITLGYSVTSNKDWFGPQGWRLPTASEMYGLFDTFFEPEFVDSGNGTMTVAEGDGQSDLIRSRNSWLFDFGTNAEEVIGSNIPDDAIIKSLGLYLDENDDVQLMGFEFNTLYPLSTVIYGPGFDSVGLDVDTHYEDYGVFMVRTSAVPVPPAVWLFGSGLIGLIGIARRKV